MSSTPPFPMSPTGEEGDPLGLNKGSTEEQEQAAEAEHDEQEPSVITLDEVEKAAEGNSDT